MSVDTSTTWTRTRIEWRQEPRIGRLVSPDLQPEAAIRIARSSTATWGKALCAAMVITWALSFATSFTFSLTLLNFIAFAAAVAGLHFPGAGLLGIGMLCALEPITAPLLANGGLWRWNNLNYWLLLVLVIFLPRTIRLRDAHSRLLLLLVALLMVGLFITPDLFTGVQYVFAMLTAFGVLLYCARAAQDRAAWYWLGVVGGGTAALGSLTYILQSRTLPTLNPNVWCLLPLTGLFTICLAFPFAARARDQFVLIMLASLNFTWAFLSTSRGGVVTSLVCMMYLLLQVRAVSRRLLVLGAAALVALLLVAQFSAWEQEAVRRFQEFFDTTKTISDRTSNRSDFALAGWRIFERHPLGVGTGGFSIAQAELALFKWSRARDYAAHSGWIRVLAENGFPGILALVAYVFSFAWVGWLRRRRGLLRIGLLVTLVFCISQISYEFEYKSIWLLAAAGTVFLHTGAGPVAAAFERRPRAEVPRVA